MEGMIVFFGATIAALSVGLVYGLVKSVNCVGNRKDKFWQFIKWFLISGSIAFAIACIILSIWLLSLIKQS